MKVNLLCIIKAVVHPYLSTAGSTAVKVSQLEVLAGAFGSFHHGRVEGPLHVDDRRCSSCSSRRSLFCSSGLLVLQ